jgi:hypothetical protein
MSDILVSIIESVADAAAAARARRSAPAPAPAYLVERFTQDQPPQPAPPPAAKPAPAPVAKPRPAPQIAPAGQIALRRLFADPQSLIRTVLAAEILGPPIALRRQNPWDNPGV